MIAPARPQITTQTYAELEAWMWIVFAIVSATP
ncbi:hypothetical protein BH11MYX3_BH11MYX3_05860 [soil metagenome]